MVRFPPRTISAAALTPRRRSSIAGPASGPVSGPGLLLLCGRPAPAALPASDAIQRRAQVPKPELKHVEVSADGFAE